MMKNQLLSENQVKEMLDVTDFRHINKEKVREFASLIPQMRQETAIQCIEQFPNFKDCATTIIDRLYALADTAIKNDGQESINAYKAVLASLTQELERPRISKKDRQEIIDKMIDVANKIADQEDKKRSHVTNILKYMGEVSVVVVAVVGSAIGIKFTDKLPFGRD